MIDTEISEILRTVKTIALVGASDTDQATALWPILLARGYQVYPVNLALGGKPSWGRPFTAVWWRSPLKLMVDVFRRTEVVYELT